MLAPGIGGYSESHTNYAIFTDIINFVLHQLPLIGEGPVHHIRPSIRMYC
jgi:hypothetical protein